MIKRKIYIVGAIDDTAYLSFVQQMDEMEAESKKHINIELYSEGGDAEAALAFANRIMASPNVIHIKAYGKVASAAVMILAAGDFREMSKQGWVMVHEDSGEIAGDTTLLETTVRHWRDLENQWAAMLERFTGTSAAAWVIMHKETTYITGPQAKSLGLVDKVF